MDAKESFSSLFGYKPIIGMIHLSGNDPVKRALDEIAIYEEEGVNGAIIENYHGSVDNVIDTLREIKYYSPKLVIGVNILPNEFTSSFSFAKMYGAKFIQLDYVSGTYTNAALKVGSYNMFRKSFSDILVLGGVWPKYYHPVTGSNLQNDLTEGKQRAEAIVVTGSGTGKETPLDKIITFRKMLGDHPLIVGAGLTAENAYEQLCFADGAIVGSYFKPNGDTSKPVERQKVKELMDVVKEIRKK